MSTEETALQDRISVVLAENKVMNVATAGEASPWCVTCFFAEEGFDLLFLVEHNSTTLANLRRNPRVAFTINRQTPDRFLQGVGTVEIIGDATAHAEAY